MNKRQKEVLESTFKDEQAILKTLEQNYTTALADIKRNIRELQANPLTQSKAYQLEFQKQLEKQISGVLDNLQGKNFTSIADYLNTCYHQGFLGSMYDMQGQGVPLVIPIDQKQVLTAVQKTGDDFKLSNKLGISTKELKKQVQEELTRGLASELTYAQIALNISNYGLSDMNRSIRIAVTEGHRVQNEARMDSMQAAKKKGADIVKQWDATLDGKTRPLHRILDGQFRELDELFDAEGTEVPYPGGFGDPAEDCFCRCCLLQRARWAVKDEKSYQKWNNETGGFIECSGYDDFKEKYLKSTEQLQKPKKSVTIKSGISLLEDCKTVSDVENLMKKQGWFNVKDINGTIYDTNELISLTDCDFTSAREIFIAHQQVFEKYPQLVGKLNSVSSAKLSGSTYAQCMVGLGNGGITVNKSWFSDSGKLAKSYASDLKSGYHPQGTDWTAIVTHELGHAIDDYLTNTMRVAGMKNHWSPKYVSAALRPKVMKSCGMKVADAYSEVSGYATKDHFEWFAECFAEYMKSPNPRKVATEFGKHFEEIMKGLN